MLEVYDESRIPKPDQPEFDLAEATVFAIDQVVLDGLVDGLEDRVRFRVLSRIAFQGVTVEKEVITSYQQSLQSEERFVDRVRDWYGFVPEVSDETPVLPTPKAIVYGRAGVASIKGRRSSLPWKQWRIVF